MPVSSPQKTAPPLSPVTSAGVQMQLSVGKSGLQLVPPQRYVYALPIVIFVLLMKYSMGGIVNNYFVRE